MFKKILFSVAIVLSLNSVSYALKINLPDEVIPVIASGDFKGKVRKIIIDEEDSIAIIKIDVGHVDGGFKQVGDRRKVLRFTSENGSTLFDDFITAYKGTNADQKAFLALHAPDFPTKGN